MSQQATGQAVDPNATIWLTQTKYDELTSELEELKGPRRADVVAKVSAARDEGDLKENAGYHAARDELGQLDARIAQLQAMLERAEVGETPPDDGVVEQGMKVTITMIERGTQKTFLLGSREMAGDDIEVFSPQSPMGRAIDGAKAGDTVHYEAPNGKQVGVRIDEAVPYTG